MLSCGVIAARCSKQPATAHRAAPLDETPRATPPRNVDGPAARGRDPPAPTRVAQPAGSSDLSSFRASRDGGASGLSRPAPGSHLSPGGQPRPAPTRWRGRRQRHDAPAEGTPSGPARHAGTTPHAATPPPQRSERKHRTFQRSQLPRRHIRRYSGRGGGHDQRQSRSRTRCPYRCTRHSDGPAPTLAVRVTSEHSPGAAGSAGSSLRVRGTAALGVRSVDGSRVIAVYARNGRVWPPEPNVPRNGLCCVQRPAGVGLSPALLFRCGSPSEATLAMLASGDDVAVRRRSGANRHCPPRIPARPRGWGQPRTAGPRPRL